MRCRGTSPSNLARPIVVSLSATHEDQFRQSSRCDRTTLQQHRLLCTRSGGGVHPRLDALLIDSVRSMRLVVLTEGKRYAGEVARLVVAPTATSAQTACTSVAPSVRCRGGTATLRHLSRLLAPAVACRWPHVKEGSGSHGHFCPRPDLSTCRWAKLATHRHRGPHCV